MRFGQADPSSSNYMHPEAWLNNIKLLSVNSGTERVMGVGIVDTSGNLVNLNSSQSTVNTSTTPIASGETFTGTWEQNYYPDVLVSCTTDNTGTLYFDFSPDGTNWSTFPVNGFKLASGVHEIHKALKGPRYFRVRLINDSGAQSYLRLYTYYGNFSNLSVPVNQSLSNDTDSSIVHTIDEETDLMTGKFGLDRFTYSKFGRNTDVDGAEDIWNGGGSYTGFPTSDVETITIKSSTTTADAGLTLYIYGLDTNYAMQSEIVTLNGSGVGVTQNTYRRTHRAYVITPAAGQTTNNGILTATHTTTTGNIFFAMPAGFGQAQVACYTVPANYTAYLRVYCVSMQDTNSNNCVCAFWTRENGKAVRIQRPFAISTAYSIETRIYSGISFPEKTDIAVRVLSVLNTNADVSASFGMLLVKN